MAVMDGLSGPAPVRELTAIEVFEREYAELRSRSKRYWIIGTAIFVALFLWTTWFSGFYEWRMVTNSEGERVSQWVIWAGFDKLDDFIVKMFPTITWETFWADMGNWFWGLDKWLWLLLESILIAYMATIFGVFFGFTLSFPASRNLAPNSFVYHLCRRFLEIARTVPDLVWALIFIFMFGPGPMAGVLAVGLHAAGALGKLYSEANENISMRPLEGVKASGGSWFDQIRYGAVPQVIPNIISYSLLRFEINVRSSSIIGFVGAGGIGKEFYTALQLQEYTDLSAIFILFFVTISIIDWGSEKLRHRIIGLELQK
ncbi:MAG: phosphonate ABC transporter, permease protein PhnE [Pseudomonadota bacterium]